MMTECDCSNIGFVNNDWLCLDCGDKVEPPKDDDEFLKMDEMLNEATGCPHYELIIDSIQEHFDNAPGDLIPQDVLLNAIRHYGKALEDALKLNEAMKKSLREYLDIEHGWC
tara:strand:- start:6686 stop:7021 length:336 start_codon:yes stop_codon:yes gene_type:complete